MLVKDHFIGQNPPGFFQELLLKTQKDIRIEIKRF